MTPLLLAATLAGAPALPDLSAREDRPPNLVLIVADDLGVMDLSMYGGALVATPNLDALAAGGVVFDDATVTSPICAPSRAGLLTGRYPQRFGFELITHGVNPPGPVGRAAARALLTRDGWELAPRGPRSSAEARHEQGLPDGELTLADLLKRRGYATGIFGKWHLGVAADRVPQARGFDEQYGIYEAHTLYADRSSPDVVSLRLDHFADRRQWRVGRKGDCAVRRNGEVIDEPRYLTEAIAQEASGFIDAHKDEPFFLYVPFTAPHAPFQASREIYDALGDITDPGRRTYAAMVRSLDDAVGTVLLALDRAGLNEDTVVVFISDNGGASYTHIVDNSPLAGGKLTHLEGGLRVPMMMRWPGHLPEGARYQPPVSALDVLPTLMAASATELPQDRPYDGVSLLPFVRGERDAAPHEALYWHAGGSSAMRQGNYKLMMDATTHDVALYDLATDPGEQMDLSGQQPERLEAMRLALDSWEATLAPSMWPPLMQYRIENAGKTWVFPL